MQTSSDKRSRDWHFVMPPIVKRENDRSRNEGKSRAVSYVGFSRVLVRRSGARKHCESFEKRQKLILPN